MMSNKSIGSYKLSFVKKTQEIFNNARKASGGKGLRRMSDDSTFSVCLILAFSSPTSDPAAGKAYIR